MNKKGFGRFGKGSAMLTSALVMGSSLGASATQESVANDSKIFFNNSSCETAIAKSSLAVITPAVYDMNKSVSLNPFS